MKTTQFLIAWLPPSRPGYVSHVTRGLTRYATKPAAEKQIARFARHFANRYFLEVAP